MQAITRWSVQGLPAEQGRGRAPFRGRLRPLHCDPLSHSGLWGNRLRLTTPGLEQRARLGPGAFPGLAPRSWVSFSLGAGTTRGRSQGCLRACVHAGQREKPGREQERRESHRARLSPDLSTSLSLALPGPCFLLSSGTPRGAAGPGRCQDLQEPVAQLLQALGEITQRTSCYGGYGQHILSLPEVGTSILLLNLPLPSHP